MPEFLRSAPKWPEGDLWALCTLPEIIKYYNEKAPASSHTTGTYYNVDTYVHECAYSLDNDVTPWTPHTMHTGIYTIMALDGWMDRSVDGWMRLRWMEWVGDAWMAK